MRPIVVGVDGSAAVLHAAPWAATEAGRRATALRLAHGCALVPPGHSDPVALLGEYADVLLGHGRQWLAEATDARGIDRTLEIDTDLRDGVTIKVLAEESAARVPLRRAEDAQPIVVGSRGRGGLGSVSQTLLHKAPCPVAVIRPEVS